MQPVAAVNVSLFTGVMETDQMQTGTAPDPETILEIALRNPINRLILDRLPALGIAQEYLAAGSVFQAVWNHRCGNEPAHGVADYDIAYFDPDLSYEAEDRIIRRAALLFDDVAARIELRNQARVHLWYPARFGSPYPALTSARDGIGRYLVACTCIGIAVEDRSIHAPYGLSDLWHGILRPNAQAPSLERYTIKAQSYQARWPWLRVEPV